MTDAERRALHREAVTQLLDCDPFSDKARALRAAYGRYEQADATLILQRVRIFAAHVRQVGPVPVAEREPEGVMMT